jgi:hypothetical protein
MALAVRQTATGGTSSSVTSVSSGAINVPNGDLIVVAVRIPTTAFGAGIVSVGDNVAGSPNIYIPVLSSAVGDQPGQQMFYVPNVQGATSFQVTVELNGAQNYLEIFVWDISGAALYSPLNAVSSNTGQSLTSLSAAAFSTTNANTIVLVGLSTDAEGRTFTPTAGLSSDGNYAGLTDSIAMHEIVSSVQTNITPGATWTGVGATNAALVVAAFSEGFSISGTVTGPGAVGTVLSYTGTVSGTVTVGAGGAYTIPGLPNGTYLITPLGIPAGYTVTPVSQSVTIADANRVNINFTITASASFVPFTMPPQFDPPSLYGTTLAPTTYSPNRYYFLGTGGLARCRHMQIKVDFGQTANGDEIYNLTIFGRLFVEL